MTTLPAGQPTPVTDCRQPEPTIEGNHRAEILPGEGTLWIRCRAYRNHQHDHRRDPKTGAWRCPLCQPDQVAL